MRGGGTGLVSFSSAFTLAEVLITLGVIGVVAALTLPALLANYREIVIVNQVKKSYSAFMQGIELAKGRTGAFDNLQIFDTSKTSDEVLDILSKYFNVVSICHSSDHKGCGGEYNVKYFKPQNDGYGTNAAYKWAGSRMSLADGSSIKVNQFESCENDRQAPDVDADGNYILGPDGKPQMQPAYKDYRCAIVTLDANGKNGPNQYGADIHQLGIYPDSIKPVDGNVGDIVNILSTGKIRAQNYEIGAEYK